MPIINDILKANKFAKFSITLTIFEFQLPSIFFSLSAANRLPSHTSINAKTFTERWTYERMEMEMDMHRDREREIQRVRIERSSGGVWVFNFSFL